MRGKQAGPGDGRCQKAATTSGWSGWGGSSEPLRRPSPLRRRFGCPTSCEQRQDCRLSHANPLCSARGHGLTATPRAGVFAPSLELRPGEQPLCQPRRRERRAKPPEQKASGPAAQFEAEAHPRALREQPAEPELMTAPGMSPAGDPGSQQPERKACGGLGSQQPFGPREG